MNPARWISRLPARIGLAALATYRAVLSPVLYAFGVRCRHEPSCSHYASDAVRAQGLWRGGWLAVGRVIEWGAHWSGTEPDSFPGRALIWSEKKSRAAPIGKRWSGGRALCILDDPAHQ